MLTDFIPNRFFSSFLQGKFESNLEDFYAICDQIELNLKSAIDCIQQTGSSNRYMPITPHPSRYSR